MSDKPLIRGIKTTDIYVIAYGLFIIGAKYLGVDFHPETLQTVVNTIDPANAAESVARIAKAYQASASGDQTPYIAGLCALWVVVRTYLKR